MPKLLELVKDEDPAVRKKTLVCLGAIARNSQRPPGIDRYTWKYARSVFRDIDADADEQLTPAEARDYGLEFKQYDANQDRLITLEEFAKEFAREQELEEMEFLDIAPIDEVPLLEFPR